MRGSKSCCNSEVLKVTGRSGEMVTLLVRSGTKERTLEASDILVAAGRTPNTDRLDLDRAGVEVDSRGYIRVNDRLQTTAPDVWATGESAGSPHFTHVGEDDFRIVLDNLNGGSRTTRGRLIPYCPLHRSRAGSRRPDRNGSQSQGRALSHREDADGDGLPDADALGDARVREGTHRRRRPHSGIHWRSVSKRAK